MRSHAAAGATAAPAAGASSTGVSAVAMSMLGASALAGARRKNQGIKATGGADWQDWHQTNPWKACLE